MTPQDLATAEILEQGWIESIVWKHQMDSTHSEARRWLTSTAPRPLPALFVATEQTAGRGRSNHRWWSPAGCLMLTLAIDGASLPPDPNHWSQLALVCGIAVAETAECFIETKIAHVKWPNDVYVLGKKCGGILIESENTISAEKSRASGEQPGPPVWLIGIGLNVNMDFSQAPDDLQSKATSLRQHAVRPPGLEAVLVELTTRLQRWIDGWATGDRHWATGWQERCLLSGRTVVARIPGGDRIRGRCEGVDGDGKLLVRSAQEMHLINSAEIESFD